MSMCNNYATIQKNETIVEAMDAMQKHEYCYSCIQSMNLQWLASKHTKKKSLPK